MFVLFSISNGFLLVLLMRSQGFAANLRAHLLPKIQSKIQEHGTSQITPLEAPLNIPDTLAENNTLNSILIKGNRMYAHKIARFYHTTYDVRRSEDIINPRTSHCDIMLLAERGAGDGGTADAFLYARVLGIYHVNIVYTGPGMINYEPMRFDFLWVRWFERSSNTLSSHWKASRLESLEFPPMASKDAFGFVDPALVLRGCHLIPAFSLGKSHSDGVGLSSIAKDGQEWREYYVNR
jgi:hypothetical protein